MADKSKKINPDKAKKEEVKQEKVSSQGLLEFLRSLRLAIYLFIILAALSIFGTVIQQEGTETYPKIVTNLGFTTVNFLKFFRLADEPKSMEEVMSYGEKTYKLFHSIGLMDMYHSWWFTALLFLLTANLFMCTINRFPGVLKYFSEPKVTFKEGLNGEIKIRLRDSIEEAKKKVSEVLDNKFSRHYEENINGSCHLMFERGKIGRLGVYITHCSIFLIFIGSIIGSLFGFKGYVELLEGEQTNNYYDKGKNAELPLGFTLKCEKAYVTYYKDNTRPKDWYSELVVLKDNKKVVSKKIEVNDPLSYNGIFFYQSSFGEGGMRNLSLEITPRAGGDKKVLSIGLDEEIEVGMGVKVRALRFIPDFAFEGKDVVSRSNELNNPAALLEIEENGRRVTKWLFLKYPYFHPFTETPYSFKLVDIAGRNRTGLQVTYDPGVNVIWVGCVLLVIGLYVSFFISHKRVWVKLDKSELTVTGLTNKNKPSFELEMEGLISNLKGALK